MTIYSVFDLSLKSSFPLPELSEIDCDYDVILSLKNISAFDHKHDGGKCFRGRIPNLLRFWVYEGKEIIIEPNNDADPCMIRSAIYGPILSILLRQRGLLVLHGSCVALEDRVIAFIGDSKAGKSTLAEAFYRQNTPVITDDILAMRLSFPYPQVVPSIPRIKLWPDSAAAMGHDVNKLPKISQSSQKCFHLFHSKQRNYLPLTSIYVLGQRSHLNIVKLECQEAFRTLIKHSRARILSHPHFVKRHFCQCTSLLNTIPIYTLDRPFDLSALSMVIKQIQLHEYQN